MATARATTDHEEIRKWAESRNGRPARVKATGGGEDPGILRIDFPGFSGEDTLEEIEWDEFFEWLDRDNLAILLSTARGNRFNKLVSRGSVSGTGSKKRAAKRSSTKKASTKKASPPKRAARKSSTAKASARKAPAKRAPAKKASAKKASAKKASAKRTTSKRSASTAKRTPTAKKSSSKKRPAAKQATAARVAKAVRSALGMAPKKRSR